MFLRKRLHQVKTKVFYLLVNLSLCFLNEEQLNLFPIIVMGMFWMFVNVSQRVNIPYL